MFQKCLGFTCLLFFAAAVYLIGECRPYLTYAGLVWHEHGTLLLWFAGILFVDITCLIYLVARALLLQETGRKLAHFEKQLSTGESVSAELVRLLQKEQQ